MNRILMVCLGNICRSPVAEGVMRQVVNEKKLNATVDSAGTAAYHIGEAPDKRSQANARKHNIDISKLKARQFRVNDFDAFDRIYVMDRSNYKNVKALARNEEDKAKVNLLLNAAFPGKDLDVPDPYYGGEQGFEDVFQLVYKACSIIGEELGTIKNQKE